MAITDKQAKQINGDIIALYGQDQKLDTASAERALNDAIASNGVQNAASLSVQDRLNKLHQIALDAMLTNDKNLSWDIQQRCFYLSAGNDFMPNGHPETTKRMFQAFVEREGLKDMGRNEQLARLRQLSVTRPVAEPKIQSSSLGEGASSNNLAQIEKFREIRQNILNEINNHPALADKATIHRIQVHLNLLGYSNASPDQNRPWTDEDQQALAKYAEKSGISPDMMKPGNVAAIAIAINKAVKDHLDYNISNPDRSTPIQGLTEPSDEIREIQAYLNLAGFSGKMPTGRWTAMDQKAYSDYVTWQINKDGQAQLSRNPDNENDRKQIFSIMRGDRQPGAVLAYLNGSAPASAPAAASTAPATPPVTTQPGQTSPSPAAVTADNDTQTAAPSAATGTLPAIDTKYQAYLRFLGHSGYIVQRGNDNLDGIRGNYTNTGLKDFAEHHNPPIDVSDGDYAKKEVLDALEKQAMNPAVIADRMEEMRKNPGNVKNVASLQFVLAAQGAQIEINGSMTPETVTAYDTVRRDVLTKMGTQTQVADAATGGNPQTTTQTTVTDLGQEFANARNNTSPPGPASLDPGQSQRNNPSSGAPRRT